ncbi:unnamed protein product [Phytophthora fragariaefolia]|uniref:Unnamed protein product n=1 Tax=Phytophthora fragariaefolia TaxID=1490495 RepID=A0A9W6Y326_9STRA|nr:unnamed protein product [Phytophthora fragariaefolia]
MHLKAALQQAPVLKLPDYTKRFLVTTDASGFCCGAVQSQKHAGEDHPFSFVLHHVKGSTNAVADALSLVAKPAFEDTPVETASIAVLPPLRTSEIKLHGCTEACVDIASGLRQPGNDILALAELFLRDLDLLCDGSHFSGGGSSVARPIGVPQAVTRLKASQLMIVTVQVDAATKLLFLRGYRRDPLYRDMIKPSAPKTQNFVNVGTLQKENGMIYRVEAGNRVLRLCVPPEDDVYSRSS